MDVRDALERVVAAPNQTEVETAFDAIAGGVGGTAWTYADITRMPLTSDESIAYCRSTADHRFVEEYHRQEAHRWDPCAHFAHAVDHPFFWSDLPSWRQARDLPRGLKRQGARVMHLAFDHSLGDGIVVPIHTREGKSRPLSGVLTLYYEGISKSALDPRVYNTTEPIK